LFSSAYALVRALKALPALVAAEEVATAEEEFVVPKE
jgi:hypothetical protein